MNALAPLRLRLRAPHAAAAPRNTGAHGAVIQAIRQGLQRHAGEPVVALLAAGAAAHASLADGAALVGRAALDAGCNIAIMDGPGGAVWPGQSAPAPLDGASRLHDLVLVPSAVLPPWSFLPAAALLLVASGGSTRAEIDAVRAACDASAIPILGILFARARAGRDAPP